MPRITRDRRTEDRVAAELATKADSLSRRMLDVTVPIYQHVSSTEPVLVGSALLMTLARERFLITAAHVLDFRASGQLTVGLSPEYAGISGMLWTVPSNEPAEESTDHIDLGIVKLAGDPWDSIPRDRFCSWRELDTSPPIMERHTFGLLGFPVAKNRRPLDGQHIKAYSLSVAGLECKEGMYRGTGRDPRTNLMVGYDHKKVAGAEGRNTAPALNGASGGGLWRFGRRLRDATDPPLLSAIFTEWHKGKHKYLLGTRIQVVLNLLGEYFPHIREFIESAESN